MPNNNKKQEGIECTVAMAEDKQAISTDPYHISEDGHFVGSDGFIVPKNFEEYFEREPLGVRRFVMKNLRKQGVDDDVMDMEQDLLLHLHFLSEKSKYRKQGKTDIIQCFDPERQHGANAKRFHNFISLCLTNRFNTLMTKRKKNPLFRLDNLSITEVVREEDNGRLNGTGEVSPEYLHQHSSVVAERQGRCDIEQVYEDKIFVEKFENFVRKNRRDLPVVMEAMSRTNSDTEAQEALGIGASVFARRREELRSLGFAFKTGHGMKTVANRKHRRTLKQRYRTPDFGVPLKRKKATR